MWTNYLRSAQRRPCGRFWADFLSPWGGRWRCNNDDERAFTYWKKSLHGGVDASRRRSLAACNDDERSRARYTTGFVAWLRQQRAGVRVILSLEPAIDRSVVPKKYRNFAQECRSSNVWQQRRNQAAIDTLTAACAQSPVRPSCKVLDLFSLSLPLLFDDRFYAMGDPVHVFTRCKSPVSQDCAFIATLLRNVLWAFEKDQEKD